MLAVTAEYWECAWGCPGPEGVAPYRFEDPALLRTNDAAARTAWLDRYGEPMAPGGLPGRKPAERRSVKLPVMLTPTEREAIDRLRGGMSRSEYVRHRVLDLDEPDQQTLSRLVEALRHQGVPDEAICRALSEVGEAL